MYVTVEHFFLFTRISQWGFARTILGVHPNIHSEDKWYTYTQNQKRKIELTCEKLMMLYLYIQN